MIDETESEELDIEFEAAEPRAVTFDVPEGQIVIPDIDALAEALGDVPLAFWAHEKGLLWPTPRRRWESIDISDAGPKPVRKN